MGTETLPSSTTIADGKVILPEDQLTVISALQGAVVGRNTSGVPTSGQSLGTSVYPWGNVRTDALTVGGEAIDVSGIVAPSNRIISGKVRTTSGQPQFLAPDGSTNAFDLEAAVTNLLLSINSVAVTVSTDITETGLTVAPSSNNTAAINDTSFIDQADSKYFGEVDSQKPTITLDAVGSEISSRVGQMIALKTDTSEIMWGWLRSATELTNVKRGYFFDSAGAPIVRETLINNEVLTLMETGWVFVENDGTTLDVTYLTPVYSFTSPTPGTLSQYWYDLTNQTWKRDNGAAFITINRTLVGLAVINTTDCIAARSFDFFSDFKTDNTIDVEVFSDTIVRSTETENAVNVYGTDVQIPYSMITWDNTANMETGSVAADTEYFLYISTDGARFISLERPYDRTGDLRGKYHPYNNWRYIADAKTDVDSDWLTALSASAFDGLPKSVRLSSEKGIISGMTNTTIDFDASWLKLINSENASKLLYDVDDTFDIATDLMTGTSAKDSHWYEMHKDSRGNRRLVPILTGTADADVLNSLSASAMTFLTDLVNPLDEIRQTVDGTSGFVKAVSAEGVLTCMDKDGIDLDLFPAGTETFEINLKSPEGLGSFRGAVGKVYRSSGSVFTDSRKYGEARETTAFWHTVNGYGATNTKIQKFTTEVDASDDIVVTVKNIAGAAADDGFSITGNMDCMVFVVYAGAFNAGSYIGISKNSSQLSTAINSVAPPDRLIINYDATVTTPSFIQWSGVIAKDDIIRPHAAGAADSAVPAYGSIHVMAVEII